MNVRVHESMEQARAATKELGVGSAVVIGNFDGVHRGHQELIAQAMELAHGGGGERLRVVALTFWPHPVRYFRPQVEPFEITSLEERVARLASHGVEEVFAMPFDEEVARMSPEAFVKRCLSEGLEAREVVVGEDFHFGHKRAGDVSTLEALGERFGFRAHGVALREDEEEEAFISSTRIREHLKRGELEEANVLMGGEYVATGEVEHGDARGRTLGYPTANVTLRGKSLLLPDGIYTTTLKSSKYGDLPSCTYVGSRPTYEGSASPGRHIEAFVLGEAGEGIDLYGERVELVFHVMQRGDRAFESSEALKDQIDRDVEEAGRWHAASLNRNKGG